MENKNFTPEVSGFKAIMDAYEYHAMPKVDKDKSANDLAKEICSSKDAYVDKAVDVILVYPHSDICTQQDMVNQRDWKIYVLMDMVKKGFIAWNGSKTDGNLEFKPVSMESALAAVGMHCSMSELCVQALNGTGPVLDLVKSAVDIYKRGGFFMVKR